MFMKWSIAIEQEGDKFLLYLFKSFQISRAGCLTWSRADPQGDIKQENI